MLICEKESECVDCTKNSDESREHWIAPKPVLWGEFGRYAGIYECNCDLDCRHCSEEMCNLLWDGDNHG